MKLNKEIEEYLQKELESLKNSETEIFNFGIFENKDGRPQFFVNFQATGTSRISEDRETNIHDWSRFLVKEFQRVGHVIYPDK